MRHRHRPRLLGLATVCLMCGLHAAHAVVTYTLITTSFAGLVGTSNGIPFDGSGFTGLPLTLVFTSAGIAGGEVSGFEQNDFPTADVSGLDGFVSLTVGNGSYSDSATVGNLAGSLALDVTFDANGNITADSIQYTNNDLSFDLEDGVVNVSSDGVLGCLAPPGSNACTATGAFAVPEPGSMSLLLAPILGLAAGRWARSFPTSRT